MTATAAVTQARTTRRGICFLSGVSIYLTSFFLPAVTLGERNDGWRGWECAWMALHPTTKFESAGLLLLASGLLNPIVIFYSALWLCHSQKTLRRVLAFASIGLIPASWIFMANEHLAARIGHVAWVASILMITGRDVLHALGIHRQASMQE